MRNRLSSLGSGRHPGPGRPRLDKAPKTAAERMRKMRAEEKKKAARKPIVRTEP